MKKLNKIIVAAVISGLMGASMMVQANSSSDNDTLAVNTPSVTLNEAVNTPSVTLNEAVIIAQKTVDGIPSKAEFSTDDGSAVWQVEIIDANKQIFDIEIDATSGKVLKKVTDKADHGDDHHHEESENEEEDDDDD
tara:strand:+ start:115 stop:522 length:408 start_codon:yes stop_codon:yes gene_type:complete